MIRMMEGPEMGRTGEVKFIMAGVWGRRDMISRPSTDESGSGISLWVKRAAERDETHLQIVGQLTSTQTQTD